MYTLWLMPDEEAYERLSSLIEQLSDRHQTPRFQPHVTLLSGIEDPLSVALAKAERLAQQLGPIRASLTQVTHLESYYRCLFFRTDDSEDLLVARKEAEGLFVHTHIQPFIPHISFLYGALPVFVKEHIIASLGDRFFMNFRLNELRLVQTQLTPEQWRVQASFPLVFGG